MAAHFVTFGSDDYSTQVERIVSQAKNTGWFASVRGMYTGDLSHEFLQKHSHMMGGRGYGFWIWKPQVILQALSNLAENDVLVYADSGCSINKRGISRFNEYIQYANHPSGVVCFQMPIYPEFHWTKEEVFAEMGREHYSSPQICATYIIIRKCDASLKILQEWSRLTQRYDLINDTQMLPRNLGFRDHRHDQSIWSILNKKNKTHIIVGDEGFPPGQNDKPIWATRIRSNETSPYTANLL